MGWLDSIASDPAVQSYFRATSLDEDTRISYLKGIHDICRFYGLSPSELVERFRRMSEEGVVEAFRRWLVGRKDELSPKTLWTRLGGVRCFLIGCGVRIVKRLQAEISDTFRRVVGSPKPVLKRDYISRKEIGRLLEAAALREKALIAVMASSGLRLGAALSLRLRDFLDDPWNEELQSYAIEVREENSKTREPYITFISWEAAEYLRDYLKARKVFGDKLKPESFVFVAEHGGKLSPCRFENIWRELCERAGIDSKPVEVKGKQVILAPGGRRVERRGIRYNIRPHSLRKFFRTALTKSGVDPIAKKALMGHSLTSLGIDGVYDYAISDLEYLRSQYEKALRNPKGLLILKKPRIEASDEKLSQEVLELNNRIQQLEKVVDSLVEAYVQPKLGKPGFQLIIDAGRKVEELSPKTLAEIMEEKDYIPDLFIERGEDGRIRITTRDEISESETKPYRYIAYKLGDRLILEPAH